MTIKNQIKAKCASCDKFFVRIYTNQKYCTRLCSTKMNKQAGSRFVILERDNFRCFYCGRSAYQHNIELHIDHVVPTNKGGDNHAENLVTSCESCNSSKIDKILACTGDILAEVSRRNKASGIPDRQRIRDRIGL